MLPSGAHVDVPAPFFAGCGFAGVSRFGVLSLARFIKQAQQSALLVSVVAPHTVRSSGTMRYTIVTNNGDTDYFFRPCRLSESMVVIILRGAHSVSGRPNYYYLNCGAVSSIPAHGTVLFAMQMHVPAAVGEAKFGWVLERPRGPSNCGHGRGRAGIVLP